MRNWLGYLVGFSGGLLLWLLVSLVGGWMWWQDYVLTFGVWLLGIYGVAAVLCLVSYWISECRKKRR